MLDEKGFKRKRFADLVTEMETKAKEAFGETVNTSERSPLGIILRIFAWFLGVLWQVAEAVYNSGFIRTATGNSLDRLGPHVGISRLPETRSIGTITILGTAGHIVPAGFRVSTATDIIFETIAPVTLISGVGSVDIRAMEPGRIGNVAAGTITRIINPSPNVTRVTNVAATNGGREKETDPEFRERFSLSVAGGGAATLEAIRGALLRTPGVRAAIVIENDKNTPDASGRPPKSFESYVLGGSVANIASTVFSNKPAGIETHGAVTEMVTDLSGESHAVKFSFAGEIMAHVRLIVNKNSSYPADGAERLKTEIIRYVGGEDVDGTVYVGLNMGDDVVHSRLIAAAYGVPGIDDVTIEVSTNGSTWTDSNVSIEPNEVAQTAHTIITVVAS